MALTQLPPLDPSSPSFRADVDTFFRSRMQTFVAEANQLVANLNSIAAGGAYALPFQVVLGVSGAAGQLAFFDIYNQINSGQLFLAKSDSANRPITAILDTFDDSSSTVKGQIRIVAVNNPSKWMLYNLLSLSVSPNYYTLSVAALAGGIAFAEDDPVVLYFQRTGDKGDKGDNGTSLTPIMHVRHVGSGGGASVSGTNTRVLNTVVRNTIPGATLSGNRVSSSPGTYRIWGSAPATGVGSHQAYLYDVATSSVLAIGSTEYSPGDTSRSFFQAELVLGVAPTLEVRHWVATTSGSLGMGGGSGLGEVFTELFIEKIA